MRQICKKEILFYIIIGIGVFLPILLCGNTPGLYYDAINPDYIAVQLFNPTKYEVRYTACWPYLCQLYHGNISVLFSFLLIALTGHTSVLQHHILNGIYCFLILFLLYQVLRELGIKKSICHGLIIVMSTMPSLSLLCFTQYYIELPGMIFLLSSVYVMLKDSKSAPARKITFILSGCFLGLASYCYFNYLFFLLPLILIWAYKICPTIKDFLLKLLLYSYGLLAGASFYILGYTKIYLDATENRGLLTHTENGIVLSVFIAFFYFLLFIGIILCCRANFVIICCDTVFNILLFQGWGMRVFPSIAKAAEGLNVSGTKGGIGKRAKLLWDFFTQIVSGKQAEISIYNFSEIKLPYLYIWLITMLLAGVAITFFLRSESARKNTSTYWLLIGAIICYFTQCLAFATRMQAQHMVPVLFLSMASLALAIDAIIKCFDIRTFSGGAHRLSIGLGVLLCFLLCLNIGNEGRLVTNLKETGGVKYYSSSINRLADTALHNQNSDKEVYVFVDWGLMTSFDYLTMNTIPYLCTDQEAEWNIWLDDGYTLIICYWNENATNEYYQKLYRCGLRSENMFLETNHEQNGITSFYMIYAKKNNMENRL